MREMVFMGPKRHQTLRPHFWTRVTKSTNTIKSRHLPMVSLIFETLSSSKIIKKHFHQQYKARVSFNACIWRQIFHVAKIGYALSDNIGREKMLNRHRDLDIEIAEAIHPNEISFSDRKIFATVGGKEMWISFFENMKVTKM